MPGSRSVAAVVVSLLTAVASVCVGCVASEPDTDVAPDVVSSNGHVQDAGAPDPTAVPALHKWVSPEARLALYVPDGWAVDEQASGASYEVQAYDPGRPLSVAFALGPATGDAQQLALDRLGALDGGAGGLRLDRSWGLPAGGGGGWSKIVIDGAYGGPEGSERAFRCWAAVDGDGSYFAVISAPAGSLDQHRATLINVLSSAQVMDGAFQATAQSAAPQVELQTYRLSDGSASFGLPPDWQVLDGGAGQFLAFDGLGSSFMYGSTGLLTGEMGLSAPGTLVSPYLRPSEALPFIASRQGLLSNVEVLSVWPLLDTGSMVFESFLYTAADSEGRHLKGYTAGMSIGGGVGLTWNFNHLSVLAPRDWFDAALSTLIAMFASYEIDGEFSKQYVQQGLANLQRLRAETAGTIARNSADIAAMVESAYEERQLSADYIDYKWTGYMRGETDWISEMEGGTVYHTDSWGTRNTATGATYEGAPFDAIHFEGRNPRYDEQMQEIDSRELWQRMQGQ